MATGDLTTLAKVRAHLDIDVAFLDDDPLISQLVTSASAWLKNQLGDRDICSASYTEYFSGNCETMLLPAQYPVTAVATLTIDGEAIAARTAWDGSGYIIVDGISIKLVGYTTSVGVSNVVLAYTAGYTTVPADIDQAVIELVAWRYRERNRIGLTSTSVGGESVTFSQFAAPMSVKNVIDMHRRRGR